MPTRKSTKKSTRKTITDVRIDAPENFMGAYHVTVEYREDGKLKVKDFTAPVKHLATRRAKEFANDLLS